MALRLLLLRHAALQDRRQTVFGLDGPLSDRARARAERMRGGLPRPRSVVVSPAECSRETAVALGLEPAVDPRLRDWDAGRWTGRDLTDLLAEDPEGVRAWHDDPDAAPHGGESLRALLERAGAWLEDQRDGEGTHAAITHAAVIRALLLHALGAPAAAFWALDVAPSSITELRHRSGRWSVTRTNWEPELIHVHGRAARPRAVPAA